MTTSELLKKYDVQVPRYTSFPSVPCWSNDLTSDTWIETLNQQTENPWSVYVHLPFCESLCTFCGCTNIITKNHSKEQDYIDCLLRELSLYIHYSPQLSKSPLKQIHLGGGTPTFFSAQNLQKLVRTIRDSAPTASGDFEGSLEADPRRVSPDQLEVLRDLGFNRISLGVQDFDERVQKMINRIQPFQMTKDLTEVARQIGYESVNFDLIYGLPLQTPQSIRQTIDSVLRLLPDRIALYSLALVPWIKPALKLFKEQDLPLGQAKRDLYEAARQRLLEAGYIEIGIDHFALPTDSLAQAYQSRQLHRNFMGYTEYKTDRLVGLGVSAISESPAAFHQNEKDLNLYRERIHSGQLATLRGHRKSELDRKAQGHILELMTTMSTALESSEQVQDVRAFLQPMFEDGLIKIERNRLVIEPSGLPFVRNVCVVFDHYLRTRQPQTKVFSSAI